MVVTNNIVSGTWHHGFHFIPSKCDDDTPTYIFYNNIAHSISGYGAIAENVSNKCTEVKDFIAYKVTEASIMLGGPSDINRGRNLKAIDTRYGPAIFPSFGVSEIIDSISYSELADNQDCPPKSTCDHCMSRTGMIMPTGVNGGHFDRQKKWFKLPLFKGGGSQTGRGEIHDHTFKGYVDTSTTCGTS